MTSYHENYETPQIIIDQIFMQTQKGIIDNNGTFDKVLKVVKISTNFGSVISTQIESIRYWQDFSYQDLFWVFLSHQLFAGNLLHPISKLWSQIFEVLQQQIRHERRHWANRFCPFMIWFLRLKVSFLTISRFILRFPQKPINNLIVG